jgi:5-methylcytosine-specific restriction enzyme subunit McrC
MTKEIPIRNIYYMLSYAYDVLREGDNVYLSDEEFDNIYDLFAKILVNGLNLLIKRGFNKEYVCVSDELPVLRGKVSINDTLKRQSFIHGKISCEYDELSSNVLFNQIIKTTIITLINYKKLDKQIKNQLIHVNRYFQEVDAVRLQKSHFSRIAIIGITVFIS